MSAPSPRPALEFLIHDLTTLPTTDPTDLFSQSLSTIFSDPRNQHGEPGSYVFYTPSNPFFLSECLEGKGGGVEIGGLGVEVDLGVLEGEWTGQERGRRRGLKLKLADPRKEDNRFFAHFLWNAGLQASEMMTTSPTSNSDPDLIFPISPSDKILELGAGAGTSGLIATLSGASKTIISDYPADEILSALTENVETNVPEFWRGNVEVRGHKWGDEEDWLDGSFSKVLVADCMWLSSEHENLVISIFRALPPPASELRGECLAIAGFHTGRAKVAAFLETCVEGGLVVEKVFEVDVEGKRREWVADRGVEDVVERKRWLTVARLRRGR